MLEGSTTRSGFLLRAGVTVVGLSSFSTLVAACGGSSKSAASTETVGGFLDYFGFEGEDLREVLAPWRKEDGVKLRASYLGVPEDLIAKYAGGGGKGIDIIDFTTPFTQRIVEVGGIYTPIDSERIPNLDNYLSFFAKEDPAWSDGDGTRVFVPFTFGSAALTYDTTVFSQAPKAWEDLLASSLKGKIAVNADSSWNLQIACSVLRFDSGALPKDKMEDCASFLEPYVGQAKVLSPTFGDMANLLVSGEVVACFGGWAALNGFAAAAGKKTITSNVAPTDGTFSFADGYAIGTKADNVATAYAMINEVLDPETNAAANVALAGGVTVKGAEKFLDPATRDLYPYGDIDAYLETTPALPAPPLKSDEFVTSAEWSKRWAELTTG